eukprot:337684-Lingulodinium_polyedra.AAC.1
MHPPANSNRHWQPMAWHCGEAATCQFTICLAQDVVQVVPCLLQVVPSCLSPTSCIGAQCAASRLSRQHALYVLIIPLDGAGR